MRTQVTNSSKMTAASLALMLAAFLIGILLPGTTSAQDDSGDPVAVIAADVDLNSTLLAPLTINFDFTGSTGSGGSAITKYEFDPGDGQLRQNFGTASITYDAAATHKLRLRVTDENGRYIDRYMQIRLYFDHDGKEVPDYVEGAGGEYRKDDSYKKKKPKAVLSADFTTGPAPLKVKFDFRGSFAYGPGSMVYYFLDGKPGSPGGKDGNGSNELNPFTEVTYDQPGTYVAQLTVVHKIPLGVAFENIDDDPREEAALRELGLETENIDRAKLVIRVTDPEDGGEARSELPIAVIAPSVTEGMAPLEVGFNLSTSQGPGGSQITEYYFDYGNGNFELAGPGAHHVYNEPGNYIARVQVWTAAGRHSEQAVVIKVKPRPMAMPPVARINASTLEGAAPLEVTLDFTDSEVVYPAEDLSYEFTDGISGFEDSPPVRTLTYNEPGEYTVMLRVTDDRGQYAFDSRVIRVLPPVQTNDAGDEALDNPLKAVLGASTTSGSAPLSVDFNFGSSSGEISSYEFDDDYGGTQWDIEAANAVYTEPGTYTPMLRVWGADGTYDSTSLTITVEASEDSGDDDAEDDPMGLGDRTGDPDVDGDLWAGERKTEDDDSGSSGGSPTSSGAKGKDKPAPKTQEQPKTVAREPVPTLSYTVEPDFQGGYEIYLNVDGSYSPDGLLLTRYLINLNGGSGWQDITGSNTYAYKVTTNNAGTYQIGVSVTDEAGNTGTQWFNIEVLAEDNKTNEDLAQDVAPVAELTYSVTEEEGRYFVDLNFSASYSPVGYQIVQCSWVVDDGGGWRDAIDPTFDYFEVQESGNYQVGMWLVDEAGNQTEKWFNVVVDLPKKPAASKPKPQQKQPPKEKPSPKKENRKLEQAILSVAGWPTEYNKRDNDEGTIQIIVSKNHKFETVIFSWGDGWYEGVVDEWGTTWKGPSAPYNFLANKHIWCKAYRDGEVFEVDYPVSEIDDPLEYGRVNWPVAD